MSLTVSGSYDLCRGGARVRAIGYNLLSPPSEDENLFDLSYKNVENPATHSLASLCKGPGVTLCFVNKGTCLCLLCQILSDTCEALPPR